MTRSGRFQRPAASPSIEVAEFSYYDGSDDPAAFGDP
jgi:hypothetical protein